MAKRWKCVFTRAVNGSNTGVYTRTDQTKKSTSPGILFMRNCPDGKTFYCDYSDGSPAGKNNYWRLLEPEKYKLYAYNKNSHPKVWMYIDKSYISMTEEEVQEDQPTTPTTPTPAPQPDNTIGNMVSNKLNDEKLTIESNDKNITINSVYTTNEINKTSSSNQSSNVDNSYQNQFLSSSSSTLNPSNQRNDTAFMSSLNDSMKIIWANHNIPSSQSDVDTVKSDMVKKFNRFLIGYPQLQLPKSFAHIFFTRPNLNLFTNSKMTALNDKIAADATYYYLFKNCPDLLKSLTSSFDTRHDFNPFLSNMAQSFELADEFIDSMEYGETLTGYKVKYGKNNIKSKTAGTTSIMFTDDSDYRVYKIHKAWVDYISKVYRGEIYADKANIQNRVLDYAASIYYFVCGPDGETILFWSKYTGVFPTVIPSAASAWDKNKVGNMPQYSISYEYAWKEDFNPLSLAEFNINAGLQNTYTYARTYEDRVVGTGKTFMQAPFVESVSTNSGYEFKLKFRTKYEQ